MRIKLVFLQCKYSVNKENGVVAVTSHFKWLGRDITTKGVARCSPEIFNEKIGMKLARARAEKNAYIIVRKCIKDLLKKTHYQENSLIDTLYFFNTCIDRQKEYIKTF